MSDSFFSADYASAARRFERAAEAAGFALERHPISARGPQNTKLSIDVASRGSAQAEHTFVLSSGLHGVEGFYGSAVQLALLESGRLGEVIRSGRVRCVLIHALNPWGFAWKRRVNEDNIDLNRNFLRAGQAYRGAPAAYARLDPLINPRSRPALDLFALEVARELLRTPFSELKNAVAQGQYEYPDGLFFGGKAPSETQAIVARELPHWLGAPQRVVHLDLHTGRGPFGRGTMCVDLPESDPRVRQIGRDLGGVTPQAFTPGGVLYEIRGALGPWLEERFPSVQYDCILAELGTYSALRVLTAMRAESWAHRLPRHAAANAHAREQMLEVFCPRSTRWRAKTVQEGIRLATSASTALCS